MNKNNFKIYENTQKASYKLWVLFYNNYVNAKIPRVKTLFSFITKPPDVQLHYLEKYVQERKFQIEKAHIYDNKTSTWISTYDKTTLTWREPTEQERQRRKIANN